MLLDENALTPLQQAVVTATNDRDNLTLFINGRAGTGKTTAVQQRLLHLLRAGEPAYTILVLVGDPAQRDSFSDTMRSSDIGSFAELKLVHYSQLAREMVILFWPLVARDAGFAAAFRPPTFLGYDLAQLLMWQTIQPLLDSGAFVDLRLRPQQIVSQLLDTLNRAALNNLDIFAATQRQIDTWAGEPDHVRNLMQARDAAIAFRERCLDNNLLDLSLTTATFNQHVLAHPEFSRYFSERFRHLIVDNVEEQTPAGQAFIAQLLDKTVSTTIVYDTDGGYRRFLAADPVGSADFEKVATETFVFTESFTAQDSVNALAAVVKGALQGVPVPQAVTTAQTGVISVISERYRREMVFALADELAKLVYEKGFHPRDIAIIAPYLDGAVRYSLTQALKQVGLPTNAVRRRASPREEPRVRAWLTWLALAHPDWGIFPTTFDVAEALTLSIAGLDPARAALVTQHLYRPNTLVLHDSAELTEPIADRIGVELLTLVDKIRVWLAENGGAYPLDQFIYQLFNDLLAGRDFQPEPDIAGAAVCDWLVRTASYLVESGSRLGLNTPAAIGQAFLNSINQGLISSNPPDTGDPPDPDGIVITTIYGFLLRSQAARVQVWLDTAASGWWDIPRQPLSNAFVLAQSWNPERAWTMAEEIDIRNELLARLVRGLSARCHDGIILATSDLDRRGARQDGALWRALAPVLSDPLVSSL
ncbi:MAG: hypothetical protein M9928_03855 [Anaerolineae bacterium]|nr:hypothetical protein [Anaerolineae bacterium]